MVEAAGGAQQASSTMGIWLSPFTGGRFWHSALSCSSWVLSHWGRESRKLSRHQTLKSPGATLQQGHSVALLSPS